MLKLKVQWSMTVSHFFSTKPPSLGEKGISQGSESKRSLKGSSGSLGSYMICKIPHHVKPVKMNGERTRPMNWTPVMSLRFPPGAVGTEHAFLLSLIGIDFQRKRIICRKTFWESPSWRARRQRQNQQTKKQTKQNLSTPGLSGAPGVCRLWTVPHSERASPWSD